MTAEPLPRTFLRLNEPLVSMIFFAPEMLEAYQRLGGLDPYEGYFCSRSAALGRASPEVVTATFYNFHPDLVRRAVEGGWTKTTPEAITEARFEAAGAALRRLLAEEDGSLPDTAELEALLWEAVAHAPPPGRALYAAHLAQPRREDPLQRLWQAANLLREFRGDGHVAVLLANGVGPLEALVLHAPVLGVPLERLVATRQWPPDAVREAQERLTRQGLVDGERLTPRGAAFREEIEAQTDRLAAAPFEALGERAGRLLQLLRPLARRIVERKGVPRFMRADEA